MYVFKDDRVIEFDGLLSANTLTEFLLDVSNLRADSQLLSLINTGLSNVTNLLYFFYLLFLSVSSCWRSLWR